MGVTTLNLPTGTGVIAHGYQIVGSPAMTTGKVFYVQSTHSLAANDSGHGGQDRPYSSIEYAMSKTTANAGDVIVAMPTHVETVTAAGGLAIDVAGVTIYGMGRGSARPQINFTTAVGASMVVSAANCCMVNILFTGGIDALTNPVHIQAADFALIACETRDVTGQATDFIVTTAAADRLVISGWKHAGAAAAGADTAISIVGGDGIVIEDFHIVGNFAVAAIENVTTACTNIIIRGGSRPSYARTVNAADVIVTLAATSTGNIGPNIHMRLQDNAANVTEALVGAAAQFFSPLLIVNADGEAGLTWNGTVTADI